MRSFRPLVVAIVATASSLTLPWSALPVAAAPPDDAFDWIEAELAANDGTLPSSFDPTATDWGLTLDAVIALQAGGRADGDAVATAIEGFSTAAGDYVTGEAFGDVGSAYAGAIGKSLFTLGLLGEDVNDVAGLDLEQMARDAVLDSGIHAGRFSDVSGFGDFSNGFGQAFNIMGLAGTVTGVPAGTVEFLLEQQCPAGSFRLTFDAADPADSTRGCESDDEGDTDATALALSALLTVEPSDEIRAAIEGATAWLLEQQGDDGGFGGTGPTADPNANTTGVVARALRAAGELDAARLAAAYVETLQLDGATVVGTPAADDAGAIALNAAARTAAVGAGIDAGARDQWRRATTQGVLALEAAPAVTPVVPARLLDSRPGESTVDGEQAGGGRAAAGDVVVLDVVGRGGVPEGASGVVLNVTALGADGPGYVTVFACDAERPVASNLNFTVGTVQPNLVVSALGADGTVCLYVGVSDVHLIADVGGYLS